MFCSAQLQGSELSQCHPAILFPFHRRTRRHLTHTLTHTRTCTCSPSTNIHLLFFALPQRMNERCRRKGRCTTDDVCILNESYQLCNVGDTPKIITAQFQPASTLCTVLRIVVPDMFKMLSSLIWVILHSPAVIVQLLYYYLELYTGWAIPSDVLLWFGASECQLFLSNVSSRKAVRNRRSVLWKISKTLLP